MRATAAASALALTQALAESDLAPSKGLWFVTRGAQVLERERGGELAGATTLGPGQGGSAGGAPAAAAECSTSTPPDAASPSDLVNELLYSDAETHIAHRFGRRQGARLVRAAAVTASAGSAGRARLDAGARCRRLPRRHPGGAGAAAAAWSPARDSCRDRGLRAQFPRRVYRHRSRRRLHGRRVLRPGAGGWRWRLQRCRGRSGRRNDV